MPLVPTRRGFLLGLAGTAVLGAGCATVAGTERHGATALDAVIARLAAGASPDQPYRHPSPTERDRALAALAGLREPTLSPDTVAAVGELGFAADAATDPVTGRPYHLAVSPSDTERSWGALVVDHGAQASLLIEVPHTRSDRRTEEVGLALFRAVPGSVLLVAGAHRDAADGTADVARERDSLFHAVATHLADQGLAQVQLPGYADDSLAGKQVVVSPGAGEPAGLTERIADRIEAAGLVVCRVWREDCGYLAGRKNVQGIDAAEGGHPFVHLEINRSVREDDEQRSTLVAALAAVAADPP